MPERLGPRRGWDTVTSERTLAAKEGEGLAEGPSMPGNKRKVNFGGQQVEATVMPYQTGAENWNEYLVDDGTVIRVKLVVTEVLRVEGSYDQQGNPLYLINSTNVTTVSSPDNLRQGGS
jgi:hypothetical protein